MSRIKFEPFGRDWYDPYKLINHTETRNALIRAFWSGLKYSGKGYTECVKICSKEFCLSKERIEGIIIERPLQK